MKILGIVILYHPEEDVVANISSYIENVDELIVWYNSPAIINLPENQKIVSMGDGTNVGLGKALNEAVKYAQANGFTHLLTMDQDTYFEEGDFTKYVLMVNEANEMAIFCPNYNIWGKQLYTSSNPFIEIEACIQSGSIYPIPVFDVIGLFREDWIVDCVDCEFAYRAKKQNILTKIVIPIIVNHQLGNPKTKHKFLGISITSNDRSAQRTYYIIRNNFLCKKIYPQHNRYLFYNFYKRLFLVLFFEKDKQAKLKALLLGYIHGKTGRIGEFFVK
jgi:rhamnosyltransferase